jgi:ribosomal protein S18 acetylase RimI-like enzyme
VHVQVVDADATVDLRRTVLRPGLRADEPMPSFAPADAVHLGAFDEFGVVVGSCVVFPEPYPGEPQRTRAWQLRGMATDTARHGSGIGTAVLGEAMAQVRARGGERMWCNARVSAIGFYERNGWVVDSEVFLNRDSGLPHRRMSRELLPDAASSE